MMMRLLLLIGFVCIGTFSFGQSIAELEEQLADAESAKDKMLLHYQLGEAHLRADAEKALNHAKFAYNHANDLNNAGMAGGSAYLAALAYERKRDDRNSEVWLRTATNYAKKAGDADLLIKSVDKRSRLATKERNYRKAYEINQEAFNYFSGKGTSLSDLESKYEAQKAQLAREKRELEIQKDQLEFEVTNLRFDKEEISKDKSVLEQQQERLLQSNQEKEQQITTKEKELVSISKEKEQAEEKAQRKEEEVAQLSEKDAKNQLIIESQRAEVAVAQLAAQKNEYFRNLSVAATGIVLLLLLLFYTRYRAKRKAANVLTEKNKIIDEERKRSDELLLNILPTPIAAELKEFGKAKARKYQDATVLFTDFINFTHISEQLSPEELVEELDKCFKAFDFIIGQYDDIEKIKTIGDAYMCASGLNGRKTIPYNMVKAALEMQGFLDEQKHERLRQGKPFFEARIGLHTGPVVAGVVGVKKFQYDIWGDTVNTAARVESKSEAGRVNISETTYNLVRYKFDCDYRGKVEAKNKGFIDMYFVNKEVAVPITAGMVV